MAKKSILDDAKKHVWHKSQVLYGMSEFWSIREKVKSMWDNTKAEPNRERIPLQHRMVNRFKEEMEKEVMFYAPFAEKDKFNGGGMRLDTYFNEVEPEIERYFDEGMDETSVWHVSIDIFGNKEGYFGSSRNINKVFDLDKQISETGEISCISGEAVKTEKGLYTPAGVHEVYLSIGMKFEFRLCFSVASYYVPEFEELSGELTHRELATYAEAICLYIALRNELNKLKEEAELYRIPLEKETKPNQRVQDNESWRTERAEKYFKKALEAGLMVEADGFSWHKFPKTALAYFLQRVYDPDPKAHQEIPYKLLNKLFGVTRLDVSLDKYNSSLQKQAWKKEIDKLFE